MDHFSYENGELRAENVSLALIAEQVGTPVYCYSAATFVRHFRVYDDALAGLDHTVCYAVKANSNQAIISLLAREGAGADVVSGGELTRALAAGVPASKIVFSGVGKTEEELARAIELGIFQINVESDHELDIISRHASAAGRDMNIAIRINPDVDAKTHEKITTGKSENKFGIDWDRASTIFDRARALPGIKAEGVAVHIGSQLTDLAPYRAAYERLRDVASGLRATGHNITRLDLGGGLGISYDAEEPPLPKDYGAMVREVIGDMGCHVTVEPGRLIAANAGVLLSRVVNVKRGSSRTFMIVDAAMNDLIRPALYSAFHEIVPLKQPNPEAGLEPIDVVGPVCETGDTFAKERHLPAVMEGDFVAFRSAGAYSAVMASTYNTRPLVPEVLVSGDQFDVIRRRWEVEDMLALETVPDWLSQPGSGEDEAGPSTAIAGAAE